MTNESLAALAIALLAAATAYAKADSDAERKHVEAVKEMVAYQLKDPDSAKFRNVRAKFRDATIGDGVVCGEVNAKNSYGGYIGFKRFYGNKMYRDRPGYSASIEGEGPELDRAVFATMWTKFCGPGPLPPS